MKIIHFLPALLSVCVFALPAQAGNAAAVTTDLNLRAGPATSYPVVTVVPQSANVQLFGCNANVSWCDIAYGQHRGWASANYIRVSSGSQPVVVTPAVAATVGIATVTYNRVYWDTYYSSYPWYGRWNVYYSPPPPNGGKGGAAGCVGAACGGTQVTTGTQGGSARRSGACFNGNCASRQTVTTPSGQKATRTVTCKRGDPSCTVTGAGPRGNSATRQRGWKR